jgi:hypothetical protein
MDSPPLSIGVDCAVSSSKTEESKRTCMNFRAYTLFSSYVLYIYMHAPYRHINIYYTIDTDNFTASMFQIRRVTWRGGLRLFEQHFTEPPGCELRRELIAGSLLRGKNMRGQQWKTWFSHVLTCFFAPIFLEHPVRILSISWSNCAWEKWQCHLRKLGGKWWFGSGNPQTRKGQTFWGMLRVGLHGQIYPYDSVTSL